MMENLLTDPAGAAKRAFEMISRQERPTFESLSDDIASATGKRIDVRQVDGFGRWGASALWLELDDRHLLLEATPVSTHHQRWVRTHEFGHIVFAHLGWAKAPEYASLSEGAGLPELVGAMRRHRVSLFAAAEQAAEEFARVADTEIRRSAGVGLSNSYWVNMS